MSTERCDKDISENVKDGLELPISILVLGMAGSGKSTLTSKFANFLEANQKRCLRVNLDPAVDDTAYFANIDIRDTINCEGIKEQYSIGPNGGIMTSLNLFTTKFNKVMDLLSQKASTHKHFIFDTPGQIEVFYWSASGQIISESLASSMPTVILYIMDTPDSDDISSFMRNMLCACLISAIFSVPFIPVFNKIDVQDSTKLIQWMKDFEMLGEELRKDQSPREDFSLFLYLEEFYNDFKPVSVSAVTGSGFEELLKAIDDAKDEYIRDFKPAYEKMQEKSKKKIESMFEMLSKMGLDQVTGDVSFKETKEIECETLCE